MSKELIEAPKAGTALTVVQRAVAAIGLTDAKKAELKELAARTASISAITNADGYKQVHSGRMALKNERVELEKLGKAARQDATDFSKAVIAQEKLAIGIIAPEETRLQALQDEHDARVEREKQAKIEAEQKRVQDIQDRIIELRAVVEVCTRYSCTSAEIAEHMGDIERIPVDDSFEEFRQQAEDAKLSTLVKLREAHAAATHREHEQLQAARAQAELAQLRAEKEAREAKERAEREERERQERLEREAEEKAAREQREAEDRAAREKLAAEHAELVRQQVAEAERIAAENKRLADERAAFEREQAEARRKAEAEEARKRAEAEAERKRKAEAERLAKKSKFPGEKAIVDVLMQHFGVPEAVINNWLSQLKKVAA